MGIKEFFFKLLSRKKSQFAKTNLNSTPTSSQLSEGGISTQFYYRNNHPIPVRCQERIQLSNAEGKGNPHGEFCTSIVNFTLNQIPSISGKAILDELYAHGHAKSLRIRINNKSKMRDTEGARAELLDHYKKYHTGSRIDPNKANTSRILG